MPAPSTAPAAGGIQTTIPEGRHASTVSASAVQAERLDLAAAQAALSRPDLTQAERHQALVDAAAILEVRAHALDPLSDPYGLTPLVRPPSGAVGAEAPSAHGRAYPLIAGEIVRHGRLAGRITAEQVLPGSVVGRGPLLLAGATYDSAADALVLGADVVPLDRMSEWLSHNTSWQSGDLVVLPIPGAASPAERLAHEIGAPVLAPGAELAVSAEGGLVSAGGGWVEAGPYGRTTVWQRGLGQSLFARAHAVERGEWEADGGARSGGKARAVYSPSRAIPADGWYVEPAAALSSFATEAADTGDGATAPAPVGSASIAEPTAPDVDVDVDVVSLIRDEYEAAKSGLMTAREALAAAEAALRRGEQPADCDMAVLQTTATKAEALYQQASMNWDLFKQ
jgi:hypothetical protein